MHIDVLLIFFIFTILYYNIGKFELEGIEQDDWEDITMMEYHGVDYIYIGDIGNNYDGRCRGINYADMRVIRFPEPKMDQLK